MTAISRDGRWFVISDGIDIARPFENCASAWKWIERRNGEATNAEEKRWTWLFNDGGAA